MAVYCQNVLAEALWGADFLNKMVLPDGQVYTNIFGWNYQQNRYDRFTYTGQPQFITDNLPNTGDERRIGSLYNTTGNPADVTTADWRFISPSAALMVGVTLTEVAYIINVTTTQNPNSSDQFPNLINYISNALAIYNREIPLLLAASNPDYTSLWTGCFLNYELKRLAPISFGPDLNLSQLNTDSVVLFSKLLSQSQMIQDDSWGNEVGLYTLWLCGEQLGWQTNVTQILTNFYSTTLQSMTVVQNNILQLTPFGAPWSNSYLSVWGNNIGIATNCLLETLIYNLTGIQSAKNIALNQLNWILGQNPIGVCQNQISVLIICPCIIPN